MPTATSIPRQTVGMTFIVAVSLLGIGALVQFSAVGWAFYSRFQTEPRLAETGADAPETMPSGFDDPLADTPPGEPIKPQPIPQFPYRPVPIVPTAPPPPSPESRFEEMVTQARMLRERGDTYTAITRLREALALDPKNAMPLAEIALTYERMGMGEKAAEHWRKVYDMGESAGVYYAAAEAKMKATQAQAMLSALPVADAPEQAAPAPAADAQVGLGPGSKIGLGSITRQDVTEGGTESRFTLSVPLNAKPRARIDVRDVAIQVFFYDVVGGRTVERTNAEVTTRWTDPPPDWSDSDTETLEVTYAQLPPVQGEPPQDRKFYGYIVRVYYKDALQDARSEPSRLGQQFPAPQILSHPESLQ